MTITVKPWLEIDGNRVPCSAATLPTQPIVMDKFTVNWGRAGYYDQTRPARVSFKLWDATGQWAIDIRDSRALGKHVAFLWSHSVTVTMFRGVVAAASARLTKHTTDRGEPIWEITLTAVDPMATLGNVYPLPGVLAGGETMEQRKEWIKGLAEYGGLVVSDIDYRSDYARAKTAPVEVGKDSALAVLTDFYESMSKDSFTYDPEANSIRQCERHANAFTTSLASFDDSRGAVLITAGDVHMDGISRPGVALSACRLNVPDGIEIDATTDTDINRVESTWSDPLDEWKDKVAYREAVAVGQPRRVLNYETWLTDDWAIEQQLTSAWERARAEGRRPRHPSITFRPGTEFATERMARWWLRCWEDTRPAFINGDTAHAWLMQSATDWPPLVSPLGGTVTYTAEHGWVVNLEVQWMMDTTGVTPMVWSNLKQIKWRSESATVPWWWPLVGLQPPPPKQIGEHTPERDVYWGEPGAATTEGARQYRFDESVTWGDLKYLDNTTREIKDILT